MPFTRARLSAADNPDLLMARVVKRLGRNKALALGVDKDVVERGIRCISKTEG